MLLKQRDQRFDRPLITFAHALEAVNNLSKCVDQLLGDIDRLIGHGESQKAIKTGVGQEILVILNMSIQKHEHSLDLNEFLGV